MRNLLRFCLIALGLVLIGAAGFLLRDALPLGDSAREKAAARASELERENGRLRKEIDKLRKEAGKTGEKQDADAGEAPKEAEAPAEGAAALPEAAEGSGTGAPLLVQLGSLGEADAIFQKALERGDVNALLQLGSDLLGMGEEGYEKLIELFGRLEKEVRDDRSIQFWLNNEVVAGRFLRAVADRHEDILRFFLYLDDKDPETLTGPMKNAKKEIFNSEIGGILLGFYDGEDPEIQDGFLEIFRRELEGDLALESRDARNAIRALAQLRGEEATDLLLDLIPRAPEGLLAEIAFALGYQGNPRALPILRALRAEVKDQRLAQAIDAAIKVLQ